MQLAHIDDTDRRVKDALDIWANYMRHDRTVNGYANKSSGFISGGSVSNFEDLEYSVDIAMAKAVEAILDGLTISQRLSVHHIHLAAVWSSNRTCLEDDYANALICIEIGLRKKGFV